MWIKDIEKSIGKSPEDSSVKVSSSIKTIFRITKERTEWSLYEMMN